MYVDISSKLPDFSAAHGKSNNLLMPATLLLLELFVLNAMMLPGSLNQFPVPNLTYSIQWIGNWHKGLQEIDG